MRVATSDRALRETRAMRHRAASIALILGLAAALIPVAIGKRAYVNRALERQFFIVVSHGGPGEWVARQERFGPLDLMGSDVRWTAVAGSLVVLPFWFWLWRRSAMSGARTIGVATSVAASASAFWLAHAAGPHTVHMPASGTFWWHVAAGPCYAAAFALAPTPRQPLP